MAMVGPHSGYLPALDKQAKRKRRFWADGMIENLGFALTLWGLYDAAGARHDDGPNKPPC